MAQVIFCTCFVPLTLGCSKCDNEPSFQQGEYIPIFPLPPVAMLKKCPNKNHHKCFTKALDKQLFQAHSVEELVAWLVESEKECSLEAYARELNMNSEPEGEDCHGYWMSKQLYSRPSHLFNAHQISSESH